MQERNKKRKQRQAWQAAVTKTTKHQVPESLFLVLPRPERSASLVRLHQVNDGSSGPAQKKQAEEPASL